MKKVIKSERVATPNAPISMAVITGQTVFVSGIVSLNANGDIVGHGDAKAQTHQILYNISSLLGEVGGDLSNIVKIVDDLEVIIVYTIPLSIETIIDVIKHVRKNWSIRV